MKKFFLLLLSLMLLASLTTVASAAEEDVSLTAVKGTPVIGSTVDPVWDTAEFSATEVDNVYYSGAGAPQDPTQTAKVKAMYDDENLYFLAEVTGSMNEFYIFLKEADGSTTWIALDAEGQLYGVDILTTDARFSALQERTTAYSVVATADGYVIQMAIDAEGIAEGGTFGVEFAISCNTYLNTIGWVVEDIAEVVLSVPQVFGTMTLAAESNGNTQTPPPGDDNSNTQTPPPRNQSFYRRCNRSCRSRRGSCRSTWSCCSCFQEENLIA